jgi:hypothetical protein
MEEEFTPPGLGEAHEMSVTDLLARSVVLPNHGTSPASVGHEVAALLEAADVVDLVEIARAGSLDARHGH